MVVPESRSRTNVLKLQERLFGLDMWKNLLTVTFYIETECLMQARAHSLEIFKHRMGWSSVRGAITTCAMQ